MKNNSSKEPNILTYDKKGTAEVSNQIMNSYQSGSINKQGQHGELKHPEEYK